MLNAENSEETHEDVCTTHRWVVDNALPQTSQTSIRRCFSSSTSFLF